MKRLIVVGVAAILPLWPGIPASANTAAAPPARVTSHYETATGNTAARDCGYSVALPDQPGQALWLFCDTVFLDAAGEAFGFIGGTTAATGPYAPGAVPDQLSELPTPPATPAVPPRTDAPRPFLPTPTGLVLPDGRPCGTAGTNSYAASWLSGATRGPARLINGYDGSDLVALTYSDVCVRGNWVWTTQAWGISFYHPASNTFVAHHRVFATGSTDDLAWQRQFGSPIFADDGFLYVYAFHCDDSGFGTCGTGRTVLARTLWRGVAAWSRPLAYRYWTTDGWTSDITAADSVMSGARPFFLDVRAYSDGLAAIEQTSLGGHYRIWRAGSPAGPWTVGEERQIPDCASSAESWCYAFFGHPELSTASHLMLSYYDPDQQHVLANAVSW
ncbi:hypothetical protein ACQEVC_26955 [Plantactinospora sp. CA-294935]|uniref:hypothetical protein n=1 Tax=Plantactinospora sp. CA-294935 TaxID=3240012 RepID=UPI003D93328B